MKIDVAALLSGAEKTLPFEAEERIESALLSEITLDSPVRVRGTITNRAGYMRLQAEVDFSYTTECARCLAPIRREVTLSFEKGVADEKTLRNEEQDEFLIIRNFALDLTDEVTEQMFMVLPYRELCREDCRGLCPRCGRDLNEGDCGCAKKTVDPRLAVLGKLLDGSEPGGNT